MLYIEIIKVMDLDVLPNAQCTQFHGKWAEKDRNFGVTLMIEPVFMRATREGVKIKVVFIALMFFVKILILHIMLIVWKLHLLNFLMLLSFLMGFIIMLLIGQALLI